ncbi:Tetratricopeptide repeat-containing domain, partial [Thalictrum thalictroides]
MAVLLGNIALLLDGTSLRTILPDRNFRPVTLDVILNLSKPKKDSNNSHTPISVSLGIKNFDSDYGEVNKNMRLRRRSGSKSNAVGFDGNLNDEDGGNGFGDEEESWDMRLRRRLKELEEEKELEKKAEELQSRKGGQDDDGDGFGGEEETEEEKRMRVRRELEKVAKEQAERRATANLMFDLGQKAYGRGMYSRSIEFFEGALTIIPRPTFFGGEIQIWLAMAYEANNRHADCIALYKQLEKNHPIVNIRRQASELRYILQAPKLKISQEERVTIPMIGSSYD